MTSFLGMATHLLLHQSKHWEVQADRERSEGVGAIPPGDHRMDEICLLQCKIIELTRQSIGPSHYNLLY